MREFTWYGDWLARIHQRVHALGFSSVSAFADMHPKATLMQLAAELGDDVAAIQVEGALRDEAEKTGALERFARALLVRYIRNDLPMGWKIGERFDFDRAGVFANWSAGVEGLMDKPIRKVVWGRLKDADIPAGWLPESLDDPYIEQAFAGVRFDAPPGK
jgi:hypothetical protein